MKINLNDIITVDISSLGTNGEGVGNYNGYTVFVPFALPTERVSARVDYVKNTVVYATLNNVITKAYNRVIPPCPHYTECGGCSIMHLDYDSQLAFKTNKIKNNLLKLSHLDIDVLPCVMSDKQYGYRNKLSLPVGGKRGNVVIGMYRKNSHNIVDVTNCMLGGTWSTTLVEVMRNYFNGINVEPYNESNFTGVVRHVVGRYVGGQLLVIIVSNGEYKYDTSMLVTELEKHFGKGNFGLFVNVNTNKNNVILGKITRHVYGLTEISAKHLGVQVRLQPSSFYQVNDGIKDVIYSKVRELLDTSDTQVLVELFSGIGVLTSVIASDKYNTFAVEIEPSATNDANKIKELNGITRLTNICGDANVELPKIIQQNKGKVMSLVVDPPRKGLGQNICQLVLDNNFDNIVYVSCDSATLARDLLQLSVKYDVKYCQGYDMFPNTDQVETLVWLTHK